MTALNCGDGGDCYVYHRLLKDKQIRYLLNLIYDPIMSIFFKASTEDVGTVSLCIIIIAAHMSAYMENMYAIDQLMSTVSYPTVCYATYALQNIQIMPDLPPFFLVVFFMVNPI